MPEINYAMATLGLMIFAFLGWWFWIICAIVARRVHYVGWAFWWVGLMWWAAVAIVPNEFPPDFVRVGLAIFAIPLVIWPLVDLRRRYNQPE